MNTCVEGAEALLVVMEAAPGIIFLPDWENYLGHRQHPPTLETHHLPDPQHLRRGGPTFLTCAWQDFETGKPETLLTEYQTMETPASAPETGEIHLPSAWHGSVFLLAFIKTGSKESTRDSP